MVFTTKVLYFNASFHSHQNKYGIIGTVVKSLSKRRAEVKFLDGEKQIVEVNKLITVGGAVPRPELQRYDYVLCCVRQKEGMHCSVFGVCDCYIPAQVEVFYNAWLAYKLTKCTIIILYIDSAIRIQSFS